VFWQLPKKVGISNRIDSLLEHLPLLKRQVFGTWERDRLSVRDALSVYVWIPRFQYNPRKDSIMF